MTREVPSPSGATLTAGQTRSGWAPAALDVAFVLGTGRCGSTLLHEIVARHTALSFISNLDDLPLIPWPSRMNGAVYRRVSPSGTAKGRIRFAPSEGYRILDRQVSPLLSDPVRDLLDSDVTPWMASRLTKVFEDVARVQRRNRFLHKFTGWPRVGFLDAVFPEARFVHVVRDGRAVANSWLQMAWWRGHRGPSEWHFGPLPEHYRSVWEQSERSFVVLAGIAWSLLLDAYDEASKSIPDDRWLQVRYEDVVESPAREIRRVTEFLGLEWTDRFASAVSRYRFEKGRQDAFRSDLSTDQVEALNQLLAPRLESLGYAV